MASNINSVGGTTRDNYNVSTNENGGNGPDTTQDGGQATNTSGHQRKPSGAKQGVG
jgi:hypothetical protein